MTIVRAHHVLENNIIKSTTHCSDIRNSSPHKWINGILCKGQNRDIDMCSH